MGALWRSPSCLPASCKSHCSICLLSTVCITCPGMNDCSACRVHQAYGILLLLPWMTMLGILYDLPCSGCRSGQDILRAWRLALAASLAAGQQYIDPRYTLLLDVSYAMVQIPDGRHLQASHACN